MMKSPIRKLEGQKIINLEKQPHACLDIEGIEESCKLEISVCLVCKAQHFDPIPDFFTKEHYAKVGHNFKKYCHLCAKRTPYEVKAIYEVNL